MKKAIKFLFVAFFAFALFVSAYACAAISSSESTNSSSDSSELESTEPEKIKFTVTVNGGTGSGEYEKDETATVVAEDVEGKKFKGWLSGETVISVEKEYSFTVTGEVVLDAYYVDVYTVTVEGGTGSGEYEKDETVTAVAEDVEGKKFKGWLSGETVISVEKEYSFTVTGEVVLDAYYVDVYTVTVEGGTGSGEYEKDETVTAVAEDVEGKRFTGWKSGVVTLSEEKTYTFAASASVTITASFVDVYTITVEGGTGSGTYDKDTQVTVAAEVPAGKVFVSWTDADGEKVSENDVYTFTATANTTLIAKFEAVKEITFGYDSFSDFGEGSYTGVTVSEGTVKIPVTLDPCRLYLGTFAAFELEFTYTFGSVSDASANFCVMVGTSLFMTRGPYNWAALFAYDGESGVPSFNDANNNTTRYRIVQKDDTLTLSYALLQDDGKFGEFTAIRSVSQKTEDHVVYMGFYRQSETVKDIVIKFGVPESSLGEYTVSVTGGTGAGTYREYDKVTVTANADTEEEKFVKWVDAEGNTLSLSPVYTFTARADVSLTAVYDEYETLTISYLEGNDFAVENLVVTVRYEDGSVRHSTDGISTAETQLEFSEFELTFIAYASDFWGNPSANFRLIYGDYFLYNTPVYGWTSFTMAENDWGTTYPVSNADTVKYRMVAKGKRVALYASKLNGEQYGEETLIREFERNAISAVTIKISAYNMGISYYPITVTYSKPKNEVKSYNVVVNGGAGGGTYKENEKVTVIANEEGRTFAMWQDSDGNVVSKSATYSFRPTEDIELTAVYATLYTVTVNGGTGSGDYIEGTEVTVKAADAPAGMVFAGWKDGETVVSTDAEYTFTVTATVILTAAYETKQAEGYTTVTKTFNAASDFVAIGANASVNGGVAEITTPGAVTQINVGTYNGFELEYTISGGNYGADSNASLYIGTANEAGNGFPGAYVYVYYSTCYHYAALLTNSETGQQNDPPASFKTGATTGYRGRVVVTDNKISLYYALADENGNFGEYTLSRTVEFETGNYTAIFSMYNTTAKIEDITVKYYERSDV